MATDDELRSVPLSLALLLVGCGSDGGPTAPPQPFEGTWVWVRSEGGIAGEVRLPDTEGISVRLEYENSRVRAFVDGSLIDETEYDAVSVQTNGPLPVYEVRYTPPLQALPFDQFDEHAVRRIAPSIVRFEDPCCDRWIHIFIDPGIQ